MNPSQSRAKFSNNAVTTVSPARLIVLCFDRIDRDLDGAVAAMERNARTDAHELCCHAQDIVAELLGSLDQEAWEHATSLAGIYAWALSHLVQANIQQEPAMVREVQSVLADLRDGFASAALEAPPSASGRI
jgi:flagellar protein FliS